MGIGGKWTSEAARILWHDLQQSHDTSGTRILMDHWKKEWFPEWDGTSVTINSVIPTQKDPLKQIDIAVVRGDEILVLVEIEESAGRGRTKLGEIVTRILRGANITIGGGAVYRVTPQTTIGVFFRAEPTKNSKAKAINAEIDARAIKEVQQRQGAKNAFVGDIIIRQFNWYECLRGALEDVMDRDLQCQLNCEDWRCERFSRQAELHQSDRSVKYLRAQFERWKSLPVNKGLDMKDVADATDIPHATIRGIVGLKGRWIQPNYHYIKALSNVWDFSVIDFYVHGAGVLDDDDINSYKRPDP